MHEISLSDDIVLWMSKESDVIVVGESIKDENIVKRAISILNQSLGIEGGVKVLLKKKIPLSAGLGGGSSDAAAVIRGVLKLYNVALKERDILMLASRVGSDVPFFIKGGFSLVMGRGERIERLSFSLNTDVRVILAVPWYGLKTADVYSWFKPPYSEMPDIGLILSAFKEGNWSLLKRILRNDLEKVVFSRYPDLAEVKNIFEKKGALFSSMSGSGSTVFGIFEGKSERPDLIKTLHSRGYKVILTSFREAS